MRGEISALHKRLGNTMIYVTHDQVEAMTMADKIAVLRLGELEQFGRPLDLFNAPENLFVAGFIGSPKMNFLKGTVGEDRTHLTLDTGDHVTLPEHGFAQRPGQKVTLGLRPNDLRPDANGALHAEIRAIEQLGSESYLYGHFADGTPLTVHNPGQTRTSSPANASPSPPIPTPSTSSTRRPPVPCGCDLPSSFQKYGQGGAAGGQRPPTVRQGLKGARTVLPKGARGGRFPSGHLGPERRRIDLEPVLPAELHLQRIRQARDPLQRIRPHHRQDPRRMPQQERHRHRAGIHALLVADPRQHLAHHAAPSSVKSRPPASGDHAMTGCPCS
jgi:hypothetical protein